MQVSRFFHTITKIEIWISVIVGGKIKVAPDLIRKKILKMKLTIFWI